MFEILFLGIFKQFEVFSFHVGDLLLCFQELVFQLVDKFEILIFLILFSQILEFFVFHCENFFKIFDCDVSFTDVSLIFALLGGEFELEVGYGEVKLSKLAVFREMRNIYC